MAHVVEGSLRRDGDHLRISAQLIRASDGFHLWSKTYDRVLNDEFIVQTDIARDVAAALGVLLNDQQRKLMADSGVRDVEAFLTFHRGILLYIAAHLEGPRLPTLQRAADAFATAIERKPDFARAYSFRTDLYAHVLMDELANKPAHAVSMTGLTASDARRHLTHDLDAAIRYETDADLRKVYRVERMFLSSDWHGFDLVLKEALRGSDARAGLWIMHLALTFRHSDALYRALLARTHRDPFNPFLWTYAARAAIVLGRPAAALRVLSDAEKFITPSHYVTDTRLHALFAVNRLADVETILAAGYEVSPILRVQVPAMAGDQAGARAAFARMVETDGPDVIRKLIAVNVIGDRAAANRTAAAIDATPLGAAMLVRAYELCLCGAMFDLKATPNFARRLEEGNLPWPPPTAINWPLKDW